MYNETRMRVNLSDPNILSRFLKAKVNSTTPRTNWDSFWNWSWNRKRRHHWCHLAMKGENASKKYDRMLRIDPASENAIIATVINALTGKWLYPLSRMGDIVGNMQLGRERSGWPPQNSREEWNLNCIHLYQWAQNFSLLFLCLEVIR